MNRMNTGASRLAERMKARVSSLVTYYRQGLAVDVQAVIGQTLFSYVSPAGIDERVESRDFIILATDLVEIGDPKRQDRIIFTNEGKEWHYEVAAPNSEPAWKWADHFQLSYRIHTKFVKAVSV